VTLPRQSPRWVALRKGATTLAYHALFHSEPLRVKIRATLLQRARTKVAGDRQAGDTSEPTLLLMVYREKNVQLVELLLRELGPDADVRLWALDQIAPELADVTLGAGPGLRFVHLNWLYNAKRVNKDSWVVLADDDFLFINGGLARTMEVMKRANFVLAQPGQSLLGWWSILFNVSRPLTTARDTNYVEQGPIVIADPTFAPKIFPLPEKNDMGWGVEAEWFRMKEGNARIGIVDSCRVVHFKQNAVSYPVGPELKKMNERLLNAGIESMWQLQSVNGRWWRWQHAPAWEQR
jgi:hypothetical protein